MFRLQVLLYTCILAGAWASGSSASAVLGQNGQAQFISLAAIATAAGGVANALWKGRKQNVQTVCLRSSILYLLCGYGGLLAFFFISNGGVSLVEAVILCGLFAIIGANLPFTQGVVELGLKTVAESKGGAEEVRRVTATRKVVSTWANPLIGGLALLALPQMGASLFWIIPVMLVGMMWVFLTTVRVSSKQKNPLANQEEKRKQSFRQPTPSKKHLLILLLGSFGTMTGYTAFVLSYLPIYTTPEVAAVLLTAQSIGTTVGVYLFRQLGGWWTRTMMLSGNAMIAASVIAMWSSPALWVLFPAVTIGMAGAGMISAVVPNWMHRLQFDLSRQYSILRLSLDAARMLAQLFFGILLFGMLGIALKWIFLCLLVLPLWGMISTRSWMNMIHKYGNSDKKIQQELAQGHELRKQDLRAVSTLTWWLDHLLVGAIGTFETMGAIRNKRIKALETTKPIMRLLSTPAWWRDQVLISVILVAEWVREKRIAGERVMRVLSTPAWWWDHLLVGAIGVFETLGNIRNKLIKVLVDIGLSFQLQLTVPKLPAPKPQQYTHTQLK